MANAVTMSVSVVAGLPWFIWMIVGLALALILVIGLVLIVRSRAPQIFRLALMALKSGTSAALIQTRNDNILIRPYDYMQGVASINEYASKWMTRSNGTRFRIDSVGAVHVLDTWGVITDPRLSVAAVEFVNQWNEDHPEDRIVDWRSLDAALRKTPPHETVTLPPLATVPIQELRGYLRGFSPGEIAGYVEREKMLDAGSRDPNFIPNWLKIAMAFTLIMAVGVGATAMLGG